MVVIGLTGGSGSGKTTLCQIMRQRGVRVIDADEVSRRVQGRGTPALAEIEAAFGAEVICPDGTLDRRKLGGIVFADGERLRMLNRITHKYITAEIEREIGEASEEIVVLDAPALIESGATKMCDAVVAVLADREVRIGRIVARDGLTREQAEKRIASQCTDEQYMRCADMVVWNSGEESPETLADRILDRFGRSTGE